jgi:8-oxo-dGTP diphosphatase
VGKNDQGVQGSEQKYRAIPRVLVFLRNGEDVLLLKGAPDKRVWANKYNGVGGHVENDEDILAAAKREVLEETGLIPTGLVLKAVVNIEAGDPLLGIVMFVFTAWSELRSTQRSYEGKLHWIPLADLNKYYLVEDLEWLLPKVLDDDLKNIPRYLHYHYDADDNLVIREHG